MDFYEQCSKIVSTARNKKGSIKNQIYNSDSKRKKGLFALGSETLKGYDKLQEIISRCPRLQKEPRLRADRCLLAVLLYEHLLGQGVRGKYKSVLLKHKSEVHSACERLKIKHGVTSLKLLMAQDNSNPDHNIPKYVRINRLKTTLTDVQRNLTDFKFLQTSKADFKRSVRNSLTQTTVIVDPHIPDLLVFHPSTDLHLHPLYTSGSIILQDKASCTPAYVLSPPPGSAVIDCCAAPGNKTTHLAARINNTGTIYAFDRDRGRLEILKKMVARSGATCIRPHCSDFLTVDPAKYPDVEYILVDPSCSGSGIVGRLDSSPEEADISARLKQLSAFQCTILKHALSFPNVKRVVYSTCSIHAEENEQVVEQVLDHVREGFDLEHAIPDWSYRGLDEYPHGRQCIRMSPEKTSTNGFFVACFVRKNFNVGQSSEKQKTVVQANGHVGENCFYDHERKEEKTIKKTVKRKCLTEADNVFSVNGNSSCREALRISGKKRKEYKNATTGSLIREQSGLLKATSEWVVSELHCNH